MFGAIKRMITGKADNDDWGFILANTPNDEEMHQGIVMLMAFDRIAVRKWLANYWYLEDPASFPNSIVYHTNMIPFYEHYYGKVRAGTRIADNVIATPSIVQFQSLLDRPGFPAWFIAGYPDVTAWSNAMSLRAAMKQPDPMMDEVEKDIEEFMAGVQRSQSEQYGSLDRVPESEKESQIAFFKALTVSFRKRTGKPFECSE
jgi:hypothetical protein